MREIKFRAIRKGSKEFLFGDLVHNCEGDAIFPSVLDENALLNSPDYYTINPETIGQFTGLRDKNGNEIFEGDIINIFYGHPSWINTPFEVVFIMGSFCMKKPDLNRSTAFTLYLHDCFEQGITTVESDDSFLFEVIGNIYQNPELLQSWFNLEKFDRDDNMVVVNLLSHKYTIDGKTWYDIKEDHL